MCARKHHTPLPRSRYLAKVPFILVSNLDERLTDKSCLFSVYSSNKMVISSTEKNVFLAHFKVTLLPLTIFIQRYNPTFVLLLGMNLFISFNKEQWTKCSKHTVIFAVLNTGGFNLSGAWKSAFFHRHFNWWAPASTFTYLPLVYFSELWCSLPIPCL